jgi:hypothetical protein
LNNQNEERASSREPVEEQQPPVLITTLVSQQNENDNKSVDPTFEHTNQNFRKSPSLSVPIPLQNSVQIPKQLPILDNSQLLQLYQQLQSQIPSSSKSPAGSAAPAGPAAPAYTSHSPANSIKSSTSVSLGQIQTDISGNQMVAI